MSLIEDLYDGFAAQISANGHTSCWLPKDTGVRQGCPMSPTLFNTFMDFLVRLLQQECEQLGVQGFKVAYRVGGQLVPLPSHGDQVACYLALLYADDLVLMTSSAADLQLAMAVLQSVCSEWGMQVNLAKTKAMVIGGTGRHQQQQQAARQASQVMSEACIPGVDSVQKFSYLGSIITSVVDKEAEVTRRLCMAGALFRSLMAGVFSTRGVSRMSKVLIYKAMVVPTLLYGAAESWSLSMGQAARLDVFNTTCLRRIMGVRRGPGMMSNEALFAATNMPSISALLNVHRLRWLGHMARRPDICMLKQLLFATAACNQAASTRAVSKRGRRSTWNRVVDALIAQLPGLQDWVHLCEDRALWRSLCADVAAM